MASTMQVESTQFCFLGLTGTVPSVSAEVAFLSANTRPVEGDWQTATVVTSNADPLWADAVNSGAKGTYYLAILIGSFNANPYALAGGSYNAWVRLTGATERIVMIAPTLFTVAA